jgi:hypothetical protein
MNELMPTTEEFSVVGMTERRLSAA